MTAEMTPPTAAAALMIQDAAGGRYVLTAELLDRARASDERHAVPADGGSVADRLRDRLPFHVVGVVAAPPPAPRRENPFWPGVFE